MLKFVFLWSDLYNFDIEKIRKQNTLYCFLSKPKKMFLQFFGNLYFPPEKRSSCCRTLSSRKALNWLMSHSTADGPCMANIFNICEKMKKKHSIETLNTKLKKY